MWERSAPGEALFRNRFLKHFLRGKGFKGRALLLIAPPEIPGLPFGCFSHLSKYNVCLHKSAIQPSTQPNDMASSEETFGHGWYQIGLLPLVTYVKDIFTRKNMENDEKYE